MEDYQIYLKKLLEKILKAQQEQKEIEDINNALGNICKELDSFTEKIIKASENSGELSQQDSERINHLNIEFNNNIEKFKKLKGL
jgi:flagellar biosynthesis chaperone FliJ